MSLASGCRNASTTNPLRSIFSRLAHSDGSIGWFLLIVRVVHEEVLASDRQFWVTRPYEWKKLLAAKVLFLVVFVNLPLFIVQMVLLSKAGFQANREPRLGSSIFSFCGS